jgi:hypothetical protein
MSTQSAKMAGEALHHPASHVHCLIVSIEFDSTIIMLNLGGSIAPTQFLAISLYA